MSYLLIVDDDEDFAVATATVLRNIGHEVQIEVDPDAAIESMKARHPDLAILDVMFPEDSSGGFQLARRMRHHDAELEDIPILMLTAINTKFPLGFGSKDIDDNWLPISSFMEKPIDLDAFCDKVKELLLEKNDKET